MEWTGLCSCAQRITLVLKKRVLSCEGVLFLKFSFCNGSMLRGFFY